jgi:hypothetical protein
MLQVSEPEYNSIDAYMGKPFSPAVLLQTVKDVLLKHKDHILENHQQQVRPWERQHSF